MLRLLQSRSKTELPPDASIPRLRSPLPPRSRKSMLYGLPIPSPDSVTKMESAFGRTPTLLLHGRLDPILPIEFAEATAAAFPPGVAELVAYDGCGHSVARGCWDDAHSRMVDFIRRLD
jgi:pimeloyl-ACP methyl ester carboxylesterase